MILVVRENKYAFGYPALRIENNPSFRRIILYACPALIPAVRSLLVVLWIFKDISNRLILPENQKRKDAEK